jgi:hypothetical protein
MVTTGAARVMRTSDMADITEHETLNHRTLKAFLDGERRKTNPAKLSRRIIIASWLAERFSYDTAYTERQVNEILRRHHDDVATLRRELIDQGFLTREDGVYRRVSRPPDRTAP